jgi:hypothetical protein
MITSNSEHTPQKRALTMNRYPANQLSPLRHSNLLNGLCRVGIGLGLLAFCAPLAAQSGQPNEVIIAEPATQPAPQAQQQQQPQQYPQQQQQAYQPAGQQPLPVYVEPPEEERVPNTVYLEGFGPGLWYSLNYERLVIPDLAVRVGFSYLSLSVSSGSSTSSAVYLNLPVTVSYLGLGSNHHMFEVGGGATFNYTSGAVSSGFSSASGSGITVFGSIFAGYRLHPVGHAGFNFRAGVNALIAKGLSFSSSDPSAIGVLPLPYISAGASF